MSESLSVQERGLLYALEEKITKGIKSFFAVGEALGKIREKRLYRATHERFEDYCRERWKFTASRASRLIAAADVVQSVTNGQHIVNERQARELLALDPADRQTLLKEATAEGQDATAAKLAEAKRKLLEGLPAAEKAAAIAAAEKAAAEASAKGSGSGGTAPATGTKPGQPATQVGGEDRKGRLKRLAGQIRQAKKTADGLGDEAEPGIVLLAKALDFFTITLPQE